MGNYNSVLLAKPGLGGGEACNLQAMPFGSGKKSKPWQAPASWGDPELA